MRRGVGICLALTLGCYSGFPGGEVPPVGPGDGSTGSGDGPGRETAGDDVGGPEPVDEACGVAASTMLRLTASEYRNSIRDLFDVEVATSLGPDELVGQFAVNAVAPPTVSALQEYALAAEEVAGVVVQDVDQLTGCNRAAEGDEACAHTIVTEVGRRVFRRPLDDEEVADYLELYRSGADPEFTDGVQLVLASLLQSPWFLYRAEIGAPLPDEPDVLVLRGYEVASRLSYALWESTPDDELLDAAESGALDSVGGVRDAAERMLADERFTAGATAFATQWLNLRRLDTVSRDGATIDPALAESMRGETTRFFAHVLVEDDARLRTVLTAPFTLVDAPVAALYGIDPPTEGFGRVELDGQTRGGLLTQPAWLASTVPARMEVANIYRGKAVLSGIACSKLPPPPANVDLNSDADRLMTQPCMTCHALMDPLGDGFANYDGFGQHDGAALASGTLAGVEGVSGPFEGPIELADRLAESPQVRACMTEHWFTFTMGRSPLSDEDACATKALATSFEVADGDMLDLIAEIVASDAFRHRVTESAPQ